MSDSVNPLDKYHGLEPFRFWCQMALPSVYDDSLSYYELLSKVVAYCDTLNSNDKALHEEVKLLRDYFYSLDVTEEIDEAVETHLNKLIEDGAFDTIIATTAATWLANHINPSTSPPIDDSLLVADAAADSKAVGDILLHSRYKMDIVLDSKAKYIGDTTSWTSLLSMPWNTWALLKGAFVKEMVRVDPTWLTIWNSKLSDTVDYIVTRFNWSESAISGNWAISNLFGTILFRGISLISSQDNHITWNVIRQPNDIVEDARTITEADLNAVNPVAREVYTEFEPLDYWYNYAGNLATTSPTGATLKHSQKVAIRGGVTYYTSNYTETPNRVMGVFFDKDDNFICPLFASVKNPPTHTYVLTTPYEYQLPSRGATSLPSDGYIALYSFVAPPNAKYFAFNLWGGETALVTHAGDINYGSLGYKNYIASFPVFAGVGFGNMVIYEHDPAYQKHKDKKLMVLGPSTVMIDRYLRPSENDVLPGCYRQHIIGAQEYLWPWYNSVESYGYSGAPWAVGTNTTIISIYTRVFGGTETAGTVPASAKIDFTPFDEYLIFSNSNNTTSENVGEINTYVTVNNEQVLDNTKQMSALQAIVLEILRQNPKAKIYICAQASTTEGSAATKMHDETVKLAKQYHLHLLDKDFGTSYTKTVIDANPGLYSYDRNGTHPSNFGSQMLGFWYRKNIIGF